jgi:hypothetical protein
MWPVALLPGAELLSMKETGDESNPPEYFPMAIIDVVICAGGVWRWQQ